MPNQRIKVKGIRRKEIDAESLAFVLWMMAKRQVEEKRRREAEERTAKQEQRS